MKRDAIVGLLIISVFLVIIVAILSQQVPPVK